MFAVNETTNLNSSNLCPVHAGVVVHLCLNTVRLREAPWDSVRLPLRVFMWGSVRVCEVPCEACEACEAPYEASRLPVRLQVRRPFGEPVWGNHVSDQMFFVTFPDLTAPWGHSLIDNQYQIFNYRCDLSEQWLHGYQFNWLPVSYFRL